MGYVLAALSALVMPLLAWIMAGVEARQALSPGLMAVWGVFPFAVLTVLYRTCPTAEQRVMFFAGAMAVLLASLGMLFDCAFAGVPEALTAQVPLLPRHLSVAFLGFRSVAWVVDHYYQRAAHPGGHLGWGVDSEDGFGG